MGVLHPLSDAFDSLPTVGVLALAFSLMLLPWSREGNVINLLGFSFFLALALLGYSVFHGLVNTSEPPRMTTNVQDLAVLTFLISLACAGLQARSVALRLFGRQAQRARVSPARNAA
jgi:hypothetical protein